MISSVPAECGRIKNQQHQHLFHISILVVCFANLKPNIQSRMPYFIWNSLPTEQDMLIARTKNKNERTLNLERQLILFQRVYCLLLLPFSFSL